MRVIVDMPTTLLAEIDAAVRRANRDASEKLSRSAWIRAACRRALPVEAIEQARQHIDASIARRPATERLLQEAQGAIDRALSPCCGAIVTAGTCGICRAKV